ncbi:MAG TPA: preprotein translocase subunit YajC [Candidatus Kapabacteria bacterium]|nr:preprotein translocase subunit YajC [Candidatus Kapabacteria bacterium]
MKLAFLLLAAAPAMAMAPSPQSGGDGMNSMISTLLMFGSIIFIFYFMIIRPQSKRQKELKKMLDEMAKGDKVVTGAGIHGTISDMNEGKVLIQIAENTRVWFDKTAIVTVTKK